MHRRVRWENVVRVAGATLLVAVVVAWPRLAPPEPRLPASEATPLAGDEPVVQPGPVARRPAAESGARARGAKDGRTGTESRSRTRRGRRVTRRGETGTRRGRPKADDERARSTERAPATTGGGAGTNGGAGTTGGAGTNGSGPAPVAAPPAPAPDPAQTEFGFEGG